ncbi:metallophosphoesterase [Thiobacillus denitrificans]|uniref:metallophosphoesterase n=1 Tax=Thiobacillus denitrificans TaxID=36861 RepID=UPI0003782AA5|nr:metallophosphoesterase [Thiobacillus denitrificans]
MAQDRNANSATGASSTMVAMLSIFFLLYGGMHAYVFAKLEAALGLAPVGGLAVAAWMALMTLLPLIVWWLEQRQWHALVWVGAWVGYIWMGFIFLFFWIALAFDVLGLLAAYVGTVLHWNPGALRFTDSSLFYATTALALGATVYGYFEARVVRVERIRLRTTKLPAAFGPSSPLKIVQIADVHLGDLIGARQLRRIVAQIQALDADLLVSTGDLVDGQGDHLDGLTRLFQELHPRFGKFAVTGNHEFFVGADRALDFTARAGFTVLRGEAASLAGVLTIAGVDDPAGRWMGVPVRTDEKALLSALPRERFTLLLKHQPVVDRNSLGLFDLQLSGHTHGGQIFPFGLLVRIAYRTRNGLTSLTPHGHLYVSRGTGTWGPPMRLGTPPELTLIELVGAG